MLHIQHDMNGRIDRREIDYIWTHLYAFHMRRLTADCYSRSVIYLFTCVVFVYMFVLYGTILYIRTI